MNSTKLYSAAILMVLLGLLVAPGSDATGIFHPLHVFTAAKLGTMALLGKGAILGGIGVPLVAKKVLLGKAGVVGGLAGAKTAIVASSLKAPLFLAKSALPNVLSLAPLLKGIGKKNTRTAPAAPIPAPLPPMLPPPVRASYAPPAQVPYSAPVMAPIRSNY